MKVRFKYCFAVVAIVCMAITSCSDDKLQQSGISGNAVLSFGDVDLHPLGETVTMSFTSAYDWEVGNKPSWIEVEPESGKAGTTQIAISVGPCLEADREEKLTFGSETLTVSQKKAVLSVEVSDSDDQITIGWQMDNSSIKIESNIKWKYQIGNNTEGWIDTGDFMPDEIYGEEKTAKKESLPLKFIKNNISDKQYETTITILPVLKDGKEELDKNTLDALTRVINITQDNLYFSVSSTELKGFDCLGSDYINSQDDEFKQAHQNHTQSIIITTEVDDDEWTIDGLDETAWKCDTGNSENITENGKDLKKTPMKVSAVTPNPSLVSPRESTFNIIVKAKDGEEVKKEIKISQNQYKFKYEVDDKDDSETNFDNKGETVKTVNIVTDGPWEISGMPDWLVKPDDMSGRGNYSFRLKPQRQNLDFEDNTAIILFRTTLNNNHERPLSCKQDKFVFDIKFDSGDQSLSLTRLETKERKMYINASGPWTIDVSDDNNDWLSVNSYDGAEGNTEVSIKATSANMDDTKRSKSITITSSLHKKEDILKDGQSRKIMTVVQDEYKFDLLNEEGESQFIPTVFESYKRDDNTQTFLMVCGSPWKLTECPDWITVTPTSGNGEKYESVKIKVTDNTGTNWNQKRSGTIAFKSDRYLNGKYSDSKSLTVSQDKFVFACDSDCKENKPLMAYNNSKEDNAKYITISTVDGAGWSVRPVDNWIITELSSGTGSKKIKVYSDNYYKTQKRDGKLRIHSEPLDYDIEIPIYQEAYVFKMPPTIDTTPFDELNPSEKEIKFECSGDWKIEKTDDWLIVKNKKTGNEVSNSEGDATLIVSAMKNSGATRNATLTISSGDIHQKQYSFSQADFLWNLTSFDDISDISAMDGKSHKAYIQCSGEWECTSDKDFVKITPSKGSGGRLTTGSITIEVEPNYTSEPGEATVTVKSNDFPNEKNKSISIKQNAFIWDVIPSTLEFDASGKSPKTIEIKCSGDWTVTSSEPWLTVDKQSGTGNDSVSVTAEDNTGAGRKATITVKCSQNDPQKKNLADKQITITQKAK